MKEIQEHRREQENKLHLVGWVLFVFCALFFIASSIRNRDTLTLIGSIVFLIACIVFIIPLTGKMKHSEAKESSNKATSTGEKRRAVD